MSQNIQDKDKKIADLRSIITQAKSRIQEYKAQLALKEKETQQLKKQYQKKIKSLEGDSQNIIKQYQQRLLRYQKTLEQSNQLIQKHQKGMQYASKNYEELIKKIATIYTIANKIFFLTPSKDKESSDAVQQLCQIQKCKQFIDSMQKFAEISDLQIVTKMLNLLVKNTQMCLNKRRQQRIQFVKKQTLFQKNIEQERHKSRNLQTQIEALKKQLAQVRDKHQRNIESIAKSKAKMQQQKTNEEFVKQLMIKLIMGPKDASAMAFGILCKVLKFTEEQIKICQKKIK